MEVSQILGLEGRMRGKGKRRNEDREKDRTRACPFALPDIKVGE